MRKEIIIRDIHCKNTDQKITEIDEEFHGHLTIHFAHGVPRKTEYNFVRDVKIL